MGRTGNRRATTSGYNYNLEEVVSVINNEIGIKLNPGWVEQLMGLPVNWTQFKNGDNRVDRLRLLGNGVVPQTAEKAFRTLHAELQEGVK
jgi:site-specific DNA-cytosine methylase